MTFWHDIRFALRLIAKKPGFSAVIVLALALGLGVNTAVFGAVTNLVVQPLSAVAPERLVRLFSGARSITAGWNGLSYAEVRRLGQETTLFNGVAASIVDGFVLGTDGPRRADEPSELTQGELASASLWPVLAARPLLGRLFTEADDRPGAPPTMVISHTLWQRRFHGDPKIIGRRLHVNQATVTVIGVMPRGFQGLDPQPGLGFWIPLAQRPVVRSEVDDFFTNRNRRELFAVARLTPAVTLAEAQRRLLVLADAEARDFPASNQNVRWLATAEVEGRWRSEYQAVRRACLLALFVAGLVVLISCANVANLLLARAGQRMREVGIRLALGSGRGRIVRQLLIESVILSLLGGSLGLLLAYWLGDLLPALLPPSPFRADMRFSPDVTTAAWALGGAVLAGVLFGLLPAWRASRSDMVTALRTDLRTEGHSLRRPGARHALVVTQLAISIMVVSSGGLFLRSLQHLEHLDPGYRTENLVSALVDPGLFTDDQPRMNRFFDELEQRLRRLPGVEAVSSSLYLPLINVQSSCGPLIKEGDAPPPPNQSPPVLYSIIAPRYFETIGTRLLFGRDFLLPEHQGQGDAVIINAELARRLFGDPAAAVGRRFRVGALSSPLVSVVGVAQDGRYLSLLEEPRPWIYWPTRRPELREENTMRTMILRARSARDLPGISAGLRAQVAEMDARLPVMQLALAGTHLDESLYAPRMAAGLGVALAVLALALATVGIYSVMTYAVSQRTREIGIRLALGGQVSHVLAMVTSQGLWLIGAGALLGTGGALLVSRALASLLHGVSATDPPTFLATLLLLSFVALLATLVPARRATRVSPMVALRHE